MFESISAASGIASAPSPSYILTVSCSDKPGIVHSLTGVLASNGLNILQSAQFGDPLTNRFFLRVHFAPSTASPNAPQDVNALESLLSEVCNQLDDATWKVVDARDKLKVVIMVSKIGAFSWFAS